MGIEEQPKLFDVPAVTPKKEKRGAFTANGGRINVPTRGTQHHDPNANETPIVKAPESLKSKPVTPIVKGD